MKIHRGMTLVELLAVLSTCTIVLSISAVLIHRTMRAESHTRYFFENERSALLLADQFRRDVHDATAIEKGGQVHFLRLERPGDQSAVEVIDYRRQPTAVERTVSRNGAVVSREQYPVSSIARVTLREDDAPRRLVLTIAANPADMIPRRAGPAPGIRDTPVSFEAAAVLAPNARIRPSDAPTEEDAQ